MNKYGLKIKSVLKFPYIILSIIIIIGLFFWNYNKNEDVIIGFSAQLTGSKAELGVQERNGVQLAIEKINESGGICGRKVSLIVSDDCGKSESARKGDEELINKGAVAIIGHATTAQTLEGLKVTNPKRVVMIGATVSTPELTGIDDYFFRIHPSFKNSAENFANYVIDNKVKNIAIIYDIDNSSYSKTYSKVFADKFKDIGGNVVSEIKFSSEEEPDFTPLLSIIEKSKPDGLLIIASDTDTAIIAQRAKLIDKNIKLYTSAWAQTETLISNGGQAVEGMELEQVYDVTNKSQNFVDFKSNYRARFGNEASFSAAYSYEATMVLAEALKKANCNKNKLKEALLEIHDFNLLIDNISIDKYGDVERPYYISKIYKGQFIRVENTGGKNE
ncbi:ABC transporter substrate-binding protein [Clostridium sp. C2-6-12]|uniref:ABC transporter substrate-binding protein n=1 Tax=Clostridium sp. C2-6-12 TaxID=2698832 RepID=UPI001FACD4F0|nr:ABC transporter substrate-binding protein [Clostridium sp. C2-6-12]